MTKKKYAIKTKYGSFECVFEPEKDMGGYAVEARGMQGAVSWGKNLDEAKRMIVESIEGAFEAKAIAEAEKKGIVRLITQKDPAVIT